MTQNRRTVVDPRKAEKRRSLIWKIAAAVALIVVAALVILAVVWKNDEDSTTGGAGAPSVVTENGSIRMTAAPAGTEPKATLTIVEDFQCPACKQFEEQYGQAIDELEKNPNVAVDYRTVAFLDRNFGNSYSADSMNASLCVAESVGKNGDRSIWKRFHDAMYANQRAEGSAGLGNDKMNSLAKEAGANGVQDCINNNQFGDWVDEQSQKILSDEGFKGTPWLQLNGETLDTQGMSPDQLVQTVNAAAK
ncbi:DsbA family protein [Gordonia zhaorongruii]|uniref:DsbA family protein n=1 Tax=Gordonia zhaorongruii TaxID=2597659 RepID=UPI001045D3D6|nr:thioredoxin domain-containing protein [Gordonia zhaorongruii]